MPYEARLELAANRATYKLRVGKLTKTHTSSSWARVPIGALQRPGTQLDGLYIAGHYVHG